MVQEITLAQWLKSRRRLLDLTQQALAAKVNCSAEMIYRIEAGQRRPSVQIARLLGAALNVAPAELEAFVRFARAGTAIQVHSPRIEATPWRDAFVPGNNLPLQLTPLIGREESLLLLGQRLRQDDLRLMTLLGPPGVGKTRLAIALGNEVLLDFPNGVFFVELAAITQAERVPLAIAQILDISLADHRLPAASLQRYLFDQHLLLILDNFEQVLDAASAVHQLLSACPLLKVLVTSRAPLQVRGERQFPVPPLALPGRVDDLTVRGLGGVAALRLFVERAQAVQPDFALTAENAATIAAICARLDGLPLALEIAAAQVKLLHPAEMLEHLSGRSLLESPGMVDSSARHRSLQAAIAWSYQLLQPEAQHFFRHMGVFADACTLEAAAAVCQPQAPIVELLSALVSMNLLRRQAASAELSQYRMLEVIRQFARQELQQHQEWQRIQADHAHYFYRFALAHEASVRSEGQLQGLAQVEREHANLQAALDYCIATQKWQQGLGMAGALLEFWVYHNHVLVGLHYVRRLLELTSAQPGLEPERTRLLNGAAMMSYFAGDFPAIAVYAEAALVGATQLQQGREIARACITLGMGSGGRGDFAGAIRFFEQGLPQAPAASLPWEHASLLNGLGEVARSQGDYTLAQHYYAPALELAQGMGNPWLAAHILDNIAHAAYAQGLYEMARDYSRRSMEASIALGDERGIAMCLEKLGAIALARQHPESAGRLLGAAERLRKARNTPIEGMDAADYQQVLLQLQQRLPPEALQRAWQAGQQMALAQVISRALEA